VYGARGTPGRQTGDPGRKPGLEPFPGLAPQVERALTGKRMPAGAVHGGGFRVSATSIPRIQYI